MITPEQKAQVIKDYATQFGKNEKDTGCAPVQVAILTTRINNLKTHFEANKHDYHSNRGLLKMIGQRKRLLRYVQKGSADQYQVLIKKLGLRK